LRLPKAQYIPKTAGLFRSEASKSQLQQVKIVEAAIKSYARHGIEKTTYTNLAKQCAISRTLIHHYFPTLDSLFLLAARYARETLLECAKKGLVAHRLDERKQLDGYIEGCFNWVRLFPDQAKFWMLYFYQASLGGEAMQENSELVSAGHERIEGLILAGREKGYFHFKDAKETAKGIQLLITGAIVSVLTETGYLTLENTSRIVRNQARQLLNVD
jgi:AcrR family transcriptional regulator